VACGATVTQTVVQVPPADRVRVYGCCLPIALGILLSLLGASSSSASSSPERCRLATGTATAVELPSVQERTIRVDEILTRYLSAGTGPPLVLLHGAGDNARDWSYAIPLLDRSHQVLLPTCPATAPAAPRPATTPPPAWPASSPRFMDAVGLDQAAVAGNSLGGLVALQLALSQAERITALCLVDSAGLGRAVNPALIAPRLPGVGELAVAVGAAAPPEPPYGPSPARPCYSASLADTTVLAGRAVSGCSPTRVPGGHAGQLARRARTPGPAAGAGQAARQAADADAGHLGDGRLGHSPHPWPAGAATPSRRRLVELSWCGHAPQVERPARFAEALNQFLQA
jgi:pimeloyl-ACP methyl ester carboxylesterase